MLDTTRHHTAPFDTALLDRLMDQAGLDATVLAFAGLARLNFKITPAGNMRGDAVPDNPLSLVDKIRGAA